MFHLDERYIIPFDRPYWQERIDGDIIRRMGGSMEDFFNEVINLWPWTGYGDWTTARQHVDDCVLINYGGGEEDYYQNVDRCMVGVTELTAYLRNALNPEGSNLPGVKDGRIVTGGLLEQMTDDTAIFRMYYEAI